jgi:hypothetical protein
MLSCITTSGKEGKMARKRKGASLKIWNRGTETRVYVNHPLFDRSDKVWLTENGETGKANLHHTGDSTRERILEVLKAYFETLSISGDWAAVLAAASPAKKKREYKEVPNPEGWQPRDPSTEWWRFREGSPEWQRSRASSGWSW